MLDWLVVWGVGQAACGDIVHQFKVAKTMSEQDPIALFDAHCRADDWREVLRLICGQIDEQFVGRIVEHLATRTDLEKWDGNTPLPELPLAIGCLSEVRSSTKLSSEGATLFEGVISVFSRSSGSCTVGPTVMFRYFEEVVAAANEIGTRWPGTSGLEDIAVNWPEENDTCGTFEWSSFVSAVVPRREPLLALAKSPQWAVRMKALEGLAEKWPDETTRELLAQRAVQDDNPYPRSAALQALAEKWPDENTLKLLESQVSSFESKWLREKIETSIESLRAKLTADEPRSGFTT